VGPTAVRAERLNPRLALITENTSCDSDRLNILSRQIMIREGNEIVGRARNYNPRD
jgi:hypothetical protein